MKLNLNSNEPFLREKDLGLKENLWEGPRPSWSVRQRRIESWDKA